MKKWLWKVVAEVKPTSGPRTEQTLAVVAEGHVEAVEAARSHLWHRKISPVRLETVVELQRVHEIDAVHDG